jgi:hypothetical protein
MSPEKTAKQVANLLMVVFKEAAVGNPTESEMMAPHGHHRAPSGQSYLLKAASYDALNRAAAKLSALMDGYPVKPCIGHLKDIAIVEKDRGTPLAQAHDRMRIKVLDFLRGFENQGQWEAVFAVREIDPNRGPFQIGPCSFYLMDDEQFALWGRRFYSGRYEPPPGAPLYQDWVREEAPMRGQFVAAARVRAINHEHARTKGRNRIEEAINLLRYGQLVVGFPEGNFPEIGYWTRQWQHDHSFVVQIDRPNFGTERSLGGSEGNWYSESKRAPGWDGLEQITLLDRSARSEMQQRFMTVLEWVGQAALAPSTSIRLVALVTALEASLIDESESVGKKTKLAKRVSGLVAHTDQQTSALMEEVEELYRNRSECVHGGEIEVEAVNVRKAAHLLARTVEAILTKPPYSTAATLHEILDQVDPPTASDDRVRIRWVTENAYLRWVNEGKPNNRQLQHWYDAEREYLCNLVLRGRPLNSIGGKQSAGESEADD